MTTYIRLEDAEDYINEGFYMTETSLENFCKEKINIVRCKDCKCYEDNEHYPMCKVLGREVEPDWFCADGKEKKND